MKQSRLPGDESPERAVLAPLERLGFEGVIQMTFERARNAELALEALKGHVSRVHGCGEHCQGGK